MERFKVIHATDNKIILSDDRQLDTLLNSVKNDEDFVIEWVEDNQKKTKLFLGDGLLSRLKDGRLILESRKTLKEGEEGYDEEYDGEDE